MVRRLALLTLAAYGLADAATLTARLDKTASALGEPLHLAIETQAASLDALDVAPLLQDFDVAGRTLNRQGDRETLVLVLYPRRTGALRVPPLRVDALSTAPIALAVSDGSEAVTRVAASWTLEPVEPRVNQPARLTLEICDDGSLQWRRPALATASGRIVRALGEDESEGRSGDIACTLHRYYWALTPTRAGDTGVVAPMLDAGRFGERLRFPAPDLAYRVRALPGWLPAHVPPVAPDVTVSVPKTRWPLDRPLAWRFEVSGGYSAEGLRALLEPQVRDTPELGVYPPEIREVVLDDPASPLSRYAVTLFFVPRTSGQVTLPQITLPWFDPVRGVTASARVPGVRVAVFDPRWERARQAGAAFAAVVLAWGLLWQARRALRWRLARRRGLRAIRAAGNVHALAHAVRSFSLGGEAAAPSLGAWAERMRRDARAVALDALVGRLQRCRYGEDRDDLDELKRACVAALERTAPRRAVRRPRA